MPENVRPSAPEVVHQESWRFVDQVDGRNQDRQDDEEG